jgi:hypothetical protein
MDMFSLRGLSWGVFALWASTAFAWADPVAQVTKLSGSATLLRDDATAPLVLGAALESGDTVATDATGRVRLQLIDGSVINLGSDTRMAIDQVISSGIGTDRDVALDLSQGALLAEAAKATPKSRFEIRTPKAITAVRGTQWGILSDTEKTEVMVVSGRVGVRKNEVSGASGVALTSQRGISVTQAPLGDSSRWGEDRFAALMTATEVPGPEIGFDLGKAPPLDMTPLPAPSQPQKPQRKRKVSCFDPDDDSCLPPDRDKNKDRDNDHEHDHEHENDNGGGSF